MKKSISIILALVFLASFLCGCSNGNNGVLSIPKKGQEYYKRVVYSSDDGSVNASFSNNYLRIIESNYDESISKSKYKSVIFDENAKIVFDGAEDKAASLTVINGKILTSDPTSDGVKVIMIDIKSGKKEEFFSGYTPLDYSDGYWSVKNENDKCGIIDEKGNEVIPCKYDMISTFDKKGYALIGDYTEQKFGMVDKDNNLVIPVNYTFLEPFNARFSNGVYSELRLSNETVYDCTLVSDANENVFTIDRSGNKIFDISNSEYIMTGNAWTLEQNIIPVKKDDLCGYIDMQGNEVIPLKYNEIAWDFVNGYSCVAVGSKYGVINTKGEEVIPFEYVFIRPFDQRGLAIAGLKENRDERCVIDLAGNIAYSTDNYSLTALGGGYFEETIDGKTQIIQLTTDKGNYETYTPKEFTVD